jgi:hypothetical protein
LHWSHNQFNDVEGLFANSWRQALSLLDLKKMSNSFGIGGTSCKSFKQAKSIANPVVNGQDKPTNQLKLARLFFNIPLQMQTPLLRSWSAVGYSADVPPVLGAGEW